MSVTRCDTCRINMSIEFTFQCQIFFYQMLFLKRKENFLMIRGVLYSYGTKGAMPPPVQLFVPLSPLAIFPLCPPPLVIFHFAPS